MVCPVCAVANPGEARFCLNCGAQLEPRAIEGERRVVTMLFCDVTGSTAMAEKLDPEEWTEIMNGAYERLIAPVYRYEGTLARLMGDAIFAFFGAPIAHEDDPQRAVMAGLDIIDGIQAYRERLRSDRHLDLNVRVGINTGPVLVGQVGSDLRMEYTAMGDAVNVAARMEQTAEPGTVQITGDTHRLVASLFDVESRGAIEVKGKSEPVPAHVVLGRKGLPRGLRVGGREPRPLVGRTTELALLKGAIAGVLDGRGQMVSLIGEAGLGKSRLIEEARRDWAPPRPDGSRSFWDEPLWQCVSYDTTRPYGQYRRMIGAIAGITDTDPPGIVREKLGRIGGLAATEWLELRLRVWRNLFGVVEPGEDPLEGEAFKKAAETLVPAAARAGGDVPRLMVFEDLHWCDEASIDLLMEMARIVDDVPFLFLFAFRPDRQAASWRLRQWLEIEYPHRYTEIVLSPLSERDSGALIDELLPDGVRSGARRTQILERTDGNPLFVEEMAAAVLEQGAGAEVAIPNTLRALITARLDRLDQGARRTLQLASVIGQSFPEPVLRAVSGDGIELERQLGTLERGGLIDETARMPEREYAFHHSLTRDAVYGTILLRARRELHLRVAEVLEGLYANRIEEFAALLAQHFREAGDDERTLTYATIAGDNAARLYANTEAVSHFTSAIEAARRLGIEGERLRYLSSSRATALELRGRSDDSVVEPEEGAARHDGPGDRPM
jgi:class 3 adenylate cyclase